MINNAKNRGFTLLELLVAVSIFSGVIVLVVSSFAFATSYQRRVRVNREVSQAARYTIDSISRDTMLSWNGPIKIGENTDVKYQGDSIYNFAIFNSGIMTENTDEKGNNLVVRDPNNKTKRYYLLENRLAMRIRLPENEFQEVNGLGRWSEPYFLTNENIKITELTFIADYNTKTAKKAPNLEIIIKLENSDKFFRDEMYINMSPRTTVSIRNDGRENL